MRTEGALAESSFLGPFFEGLVASEIVKHRLNRGEPRGLYYFRDRQGLEVDFVVDNGNRRLTLIEAKATRTPMPDDARSLLRLAGSVKRYATAAYVVQLRTCGREFVSAVPRSQDRSMERAGRGASLNLNPSVQLLRS